MAWLADMLDFLGRSPGLGYLADDGPAAEPTAWAAMALLAHGRTDKAIEKLCLLNDWQSPADGSVPVRPTEKEPCWTTSLAVMAWQSGLRWRANAGGGCELSDVDEERLRGAVDRGLLWLVQTRGETVTSGDPQMAGHDGTLVGWPWALGTHAWVEPTALAVLALKASGNTQHPRTRQAVRLLVDRLLPSGGCNYGNTAVLGQKLVPHVQPSGLALLALAGEEDISGKIGRTKSCLLGELPVTKSPQSLAFGLMGLAAHGARPPQTEERLAAAASRALGKSAPMAIALLALNSAPASGVLFPVHPSEEARS
ncbi:MAG: hypothetical protein HYS13_08480 [Planctomycetia bacterium]|nr:hypothetical protein [Planctomycetia bacterium]